MTQVKIKEEDDLQLEWFKEAREMKLDDLPAFVNNLALNYHHDYGTLCHAIVAAAVAAATAINKSDQGGITRFQAGCVMWGFIQQWLDWGEEKPYKLLSIEDMLYPQYESSFTSISADTWKLLQEKAAKLITQRSDAHGDVMNHWKSIVDGVVPFGYSIK